VETAERKKTGSEKELKNKQRRQTKEKKKKATVDCGRKDTDPTDREKAGGNQKGQKRGRGKKAL